MKLKPSELLLLLLLIHRLSTTQTTKDGDTLRAPEPAITCKRMPRRKVSAHPRLTTHSQSPPSASLDCPHHAFGLEPALPPPPLEAACARRSIMPAPMLSKHTPTQPERSPRDQTQ